MFRNRRSGRSGKTWNALSTLMLEAMGLAGVKAGRVCGFRVAFVGVLGSSFVGFFFSLVILVYTPCVRRAPYAF
jgi:hypothetical protein